MTRSDVARFKALVHRRPEASCSDPFIQYSFVFFSPPFRGVPLRLITIRLSILTAGDIRISSQFLITRFLHFAQPQANYQAYVTITLGRRV